MDWSSILAFSVVALIVEISPGPNFLLVVKTVPMAGRNGAFANIAGFACAFMLHGTLSIFGVSVILAHSETLFFTIKLLGAAYLCFLGLQALREAQFHHQHPPVPVLATNTAVDIDLAGPSDQPACLHTQRLLRGWREGFITNCLNPKISLFYLSVFPQFILVEDGTAYKSFLLVIIHITIHALWFSLVVLALYRMLVAINDSRYTNLLKALSGLALIGIGGLFAMSAVAHPL